VIRGCPGTPSRTPWGPDLIFIDVGLIFDGFWDPLRISVGVILVSFSWFGVAKWQCRFQDRFLSGLGVEMTPESAGRRCLNHGKYICFHRIPRFRLIGDLRVLREGLGPHLGGFW
jgi:hypothetical protein